VGVVRDRPNRSIRLPAEPELYVPVLQDPASQTFSFVVRAQGTLTYATARAAADRLSPDWTVTAFATLSDLVADSLSRDRMLAWLSGAFALLASLLAVAGVFGLTTVHAQRRTREIGVRLALGATVASIHRLLIREVVVVAGLGAVVGLTAFVLLGGYLGSLLFDLSPVDPLTVGTAALGLVVAAFLAGTIPASRATRGGPSRALRVE
jgi:ABC-type antimicrobial peptide transport system permease subunit